MSGFEPLSDIGRLGTSTNWGHQNPCELRVWPACGEALIAPPRMAYRPARPSYAIGEPDSSRSARVADSRARCEIRRQVCAITAPVALTLTFATPVTSRRTAVQIWRDLVRQLRRTKQGRAFGWICVLETHSDGRSLHFHGVTERGPGLWLTQHWEHSWGNVDSRPLATLEDRRTFAGYMAEDMSLWPREPGERRYLAARGLKQEPQILQFASLRACFEALDVLEQTADLIRIEELNAMGTSLSVRWPTPLLPRRIEQLRLQIITREN